MGSGTKREILEKKMEKRLQGPKTEPLISLPLDFLEDITCGFSTERVLGSGARGVVYKGVLRSGKAVAVKKIFDIHLMGNDNQVENEIIRLTDVRHQSVIQLVGYCVETKWVVIEHKGKHVMAEKPACLLCFEFLSNGSLDQHLSDVTSGLDWDKRYKIIREVCRGLHYLHDKHRIAHRDLKPQNILMDDTMMPKIADFDLSRILSQGKSRTVTAKVQGTRGYMAPEYIEQKSISFEADIFSLGVIIIEIITGHRRYPNISEATETSLGHYTDEVVGSWRNRLTEITPMHMSPEMCIQQVQQCIAIALKCLKPESNKRPTSLDILQSLDAVEPNMSPGNPPGVIEKIPDNSMALSLAVVGKGVNKVVSHFSTKLDEKATREHTLRRIEMAVSRIYFVLEKTGRIAITYVSLLDRWKTVKQFHMKGMDLLNKYKPQQELDGHAVVRSSSYYHRFAERAKSLSISLVGWVNNEHLSPSVAQNFESYADFAEKFLAEVESNCPLRHDTFRYPFLWHLFQGKSLRYAKITGRKELRFSILPSVLEGRGVEAILFYEYLDLDRLDKSFGVSLMLRISESTDIVGAAINCLQSSTSLLNADFPKDAAGELTLLHNLQDIVAYQPTWDVEGAYAPWTKRFRSDPLCCQAANGHGPIINSIISSELSQIFPEQIIAFASKCYLPMLDCSLASASDKAHGNAMVHQRGVPHHLVITCSFAPHQLSPCCMVEAKGTLKEGAIVRRFPIINNGRTIKEYIDSIRPTVINLVADVPEVMDHELEWTTNHGAVKWNVGKPHEATLRAVPMQGF